MTDPFLPQTAEAIKPDQGSSQTRLTSCQFWRGDLKFRIEAAECIRELIEEIRLVPENGKLRVKLCGNWSATEECDEKYGKVFLILTLLLPFAVLVSSASLAESKLEATIFSYDGKDFVRNETTLTAEGQSAANTGRMEFSGRTGRIERRQLTSVSCQQRKSRH